MKTRWLFAHGYIGEPTTKLLGVITVRSIIRPTATFAKQYSTTGSTQNYEHQSDRKTAIPINTRSFSQHMLLQQRFAAPVIKVPLTSARIRTTFVVLWFEIPRVIRQNSPIRRPATGIA